MVGEMHKSAMGQLNVNEGIIRAVEEMKGAGISAMKEMEDVTVSFGRLKEEIDLLKQEMKKFKTRRTARSS